MLEAKLRGTGDLVNGPPMLNTVKIIDNQGQVLFHCPLEEMEKAHDYACQMEKMGIEVTLIAPSLPESLAASMGMTDDEAQVLRQSIIQEIEEHDTGCCLTKKSADETVKEG